MKFAAIFAFLSSGLLADEALNYTIAWPSGMSLGEAKLTASQSMDGWNFDFTINAGVPGYPIADVFHAIASNQLCSTEFTRALSQGSRKSSEKIVVSGGKAIRTTAAGGGKSEISVGACAHDALTLLFSVRHELAQGKVPPAQTVLYGAGYPIHMEYSGVRYIKMNDASVAADRVECTVTLAKGGSYQFEIFFARDAAHTPLVVRAPFALGSFSMELAR
jgi:hypothetical protein